MKKLLFTILLGIGILVPSSFSALENSTLYKTEFSTKKPKNKVKKTKKKKTYTTSRNKDCTYNGHTLYVGPRGDCYYYAGSSKEYVDRSYCSGCN